MRDLMRRARELAARVTARPVVRLLVRTVSGFNSREAPMIAAATAYYTLVSLAPLMVLLVSLAGLFLERGSARTELLRLAGQVVQPGALPALDAVLRASASRRPGFFTSIVALALAVFGAAGVFGQLQQALNDIWEAPPVRSRGVLGLIRGRIPSFVMVLASGVLLGAAVLANAVIGALERLLPSGIATLLLARSATLAVSLVLLTAMFAAIYRVLPDVRVSWRDVGLGALVTAALFAVANLGVGLYFAHASVGTVYGAAGSLAVLLVWLYLVGQAVLLGAEFTHVWACTHGSLRGACNDEAASSAEDRGRAR